MASALQDLNIESRLFWRSKPFAVQTWLKRWKSVPYVQHLFGRILKPSMQSHFEDWWTSSLGDIHANHSPQLVQRSGVEDHRHLWPYIFQIVCTTRPIYVFFENVEGHITLGLDAVVKDLQGAGYIVEVGLFSSEETGASHSRKRIFILGKLANSHSGNVGNRSRQIQSQTKEVEGEQQRKDGERMRSEFESRSTELANSGLQRQKIKKKQATRSEQFSGELANTGSDGLQGDEQQGEERSWEEFHGSIAKRCPIARPGELQYEWEEPRANTKRALKSRLGLPTDGYDYRTDFLRALGNGVDPWTAKLAFETLMDKLS